MADAEKPVNTVTTEETPVKKPRKPRKPRAPKAEAAAAAPQRGGKADVELEISDEDEEPKPTHYVEHNGSTITLVGTDVALQVMTLDEQKAHGIKSITGEMGKKCKNPLVITFKTPKAALTFFNNHIFADDEDTALGFIEEGNKTEWLSPSMSVTMS